MAHHPALTAVFDASLAYLQPASAKATSANELELAISSLLSTVQRAAAQIAAVWNARTDRVWRRLPVELRAECFQHLPLGDKVALSHTSTLWRRNALDIPGLWTTIRCTDASPRQTGRAQELLRRSGASSLALTLSPSVVDDEDLMAQLRTNAHRVRSLVVTGLGDATTLLSTLLPPDPLHRLEILHLADETHWTNIPANLSALLPHLRSLHLPSTGTGAFPGIFHPMRHLRSLRFTSSESTDSRPLFAHCPNLEQLEITGHIYASLLPHGRPPPSLRTLSLTDEVYGGAGALDLSAFLAPSQWRNGNLETLRLVGVRELASAVALFSALSVAVGPWMMRVRGSQLGEGWLNVVMAAVGEHSPYFEVSLAAADISTAVDAVLACLPYLDNLDLLEMPVCIFERLLRADSENVVDVVFPAVTSLRISTELGRAGVEGDNARALRVMPSIRYTDMNQCTAVPPTRSIRAPRLQSVTLLTDDDGLADAIAFAGTLRHGRTLQFDAARLDRVVFSGAFSRYELMDLAPSLQRLVDGEVAKEVGYLRSLDFVRIVP